MKKSITTFIFTAAILLFAAVATNHASAAPTPVNIFPSCSNKVVSGSTVCKDATPPATTDPIITVLKDAMEIVSFVTGAAAVILIVVSGLRFVTSGGDPSGVAGARNTLIYALVGVAVTVFAQLIIVFILDHVT